MGREKLAPGVVGGLLVSYCLRGGLGGAPSTEGGTTSGCEGSVMESCIGETLGVLAWADRDGVLVPLVLAMADVKKLEKGWLEVRGGLFFRQRSSGIPLERVLWFGSISHLERGFSRANDQCEMKYSNLKV